MLEKSAKQICFLLLLFLPRFHRRHKMRVGRLSGGAVGWVARHGCRASAVGPWMARRRVPAPRCRSEGTAAKRGPYASAEVLVTFGTKSDPAVRTEPDSAAPGCCCWHSVQGIPLFAEATDIQGCEKRFVWHTAIRSLRQLLQFLCSTATLRSSAGCSSVKPPSTTAG